MNINPRTSMIQKNLEGLYSLTGYLSIYLLASFIGEDLSSLKAPNQYIRTRNRFFLTNFILLIISVILLIGGIEPSRRCANLAYVAWTCTICGWQLFILFINECSLGRQATRMNTLETLAKHQLAIFLIANILTGLINVKLKPLMMDWKGCLFVMTTYNLSLLKLNKLLG
jgi:phosphatidylinositol glycan class W